MEIANGSQAMDRYLAAFLTGTLSDEEEKKSYLKGWKTIVTKIHMLWLN